MRGGFTKGMIIGGLVGASMSMILENNGMKKKMMRKGRRLMRASSIIKSITR